LSSEIERVNIPDTINDVVLSRIENLDEKTRNLLDTASVIGRNFYFKVLDQVADTIGEVSERLQYLKNMQFLQDSGEEDNLEFVFKHALTHQAAYDSMMEKRRKELHLKIAESIEKVFPERISEFFGTLAMHYQKAEKYSKAKYYLIKAGDEAYASAAATEAIEYYKDAFKMYLMMSGDEPDAENVALFYEKIAHALQLGGKNREAIEYYEKVLKYYGHYIPDSKFKLISGLTSNILLLLWTIKFPNTRFKKAASETDLRLSLILFQYCKALYSFDSRRWFLESILMFRHSSKLSFESNKVGPALIAAYSITFNWTGISIKYARKLIEIGRNTNEEISDSIKFEIEAYVKMNQFLEGNWKPDHEINDHFDHAIKRGDVFNLTPYLLYNGFITIELGSQQEAIQIYNKIKMIGLEFESDHSMSQYYRLMAVTDFKYRKFEQLHSYANDAIEYTRETGHMAMLQIIYCMRAMSCAINGDLKTADSDLQEIEKIAPQQKRIKIWHSTYYLTKAYILLEELRRNQKDTSIKKSLLKVCKSAIRHSKFVPSNLIESHRIMANSLWMMQEKNRAIKHYLKSIEEAKRVNGKLELSRTYFELGKRMSSNGFTKKVNDLNGEEYIGKARQLFSEMNLTYDLNELERFTNR
jgi:tetratricopeptide (TPR) repeat protein